MICGGRDEEKGTWQEFYGCFIPKGYMTAFSPPTYCMESS